MEIEEGNLRFKFADTWSYLLKYDERDEGGKPKLAEYRKIHDATNGAKAVDFIGVLDNDKLVFIEVKDFRGFETENKKRVATGELVTEIATKVRDTVAAIVGGYRTSMSDKNEYFEHYFDILSNKQKHIYMVLWREGHFRNPDKARYYNDAQVLKSKLSWLGSKTFVLHKADNRLLEHLTVEYLKT
jgi:hypothetical protein